MIGLSSFGCAAWLAVPETTPSKTTNPFSATANCISVGSPTMAKSISGRVFKRELSPNGPELSSSAVAAIIRLYLGFGCS